MAHKAASNIPSDKDILGLIEQLQAVFDTLECFTVALTPDDRKRAIRWRPGSEGIILLLAELAGERGLALPGICLERMKVDRQLAARLAPLATAAEAVTQRLRDTILDAQSECWWAATAYYTALARMADADPTLARRLRPVVEFFATGRRGRLGGNSHG